MSEEEIEKLWQEYKELLLSTKRENIEEFCNWLESTDFKYAPASTTYHEAERGGLLKHSLNVYHAMYDFQILLDFFELKEDTIIITSLLHDLCKIDTYVEETKNVKDETDQWVTVPYFKFDEILPWGHGEKSVILTMQHNLKLDNVEISMIRNHMAWASNDDPRRVSKLFRICPQALVLFYADLEATMLYESYDGPSRYVEKLKKGGRNIIECNNINKNDNKINERAVVIEGSRYELADSNAVVDGINTLEIKSDGKTYKVKSLYNDGLPF